MGNTLNDKHYNDDAAYMSMVYDYIMNEICV